MSAVSKKSIKYEWVVTFVQISLVYWTLFDTKYFFNSGGPRVCKKLYFFFKPILLANLYFFFLFFIFSILSHTKVPSLLYSFTSKFSQFFLMGLFRVLSFSFIKKKGRREHKHAFNQSGTMNNPNSPLSSRGK